MSPRRRMAPGERGEVSYETTSDGFRAVQYYRDHLGNRRRGTGLGKTKEAAKRAATANIDAAMRADEFFKPSTRFEVAVREWLKSVRRLVDEGSRAATTYEQYERYARVDVFPVVGNLRLSELTTGRLDKYLEDLRERKGYATTKTVRTILTGTCAMLVRRDVLPANPVREVSRLEKGRRKSPRALTADEAAAFLSRLKESELARRHDLHDLMLFLLATGVRIGEALALRWCDVDLDAAVVDINGTITRIRGKGLVRSDVKTETSERMLRLPAWCVDALRTRYKAQAVDAPVFPDTKGGYRDPSNTGKVFRKVRGDDFAWVKSHTARRTLATLLDGAGLSARDIADQLGHARPSMTQDVYMGRRIVGQVTTPLDGLFIAKVQGPMEAETEAEAS